MTHLGDLAVGDRFTWPQDDTEYVVVNCGIRAFQIEPVTCELPIIPIETVSIDEPVERRA